MKITKGVIPVAGLGTRFLPYTKAVPKEMLPVIDVPLIHFIIEEAMAAGINEIIFITAEGKDSIKDYFTRDKKLEAFLKEKGKKDILKELKKVPCNFKKHFVIQKKARGLGDAILHAEKIIGNESFAVFLPDDVIFSKKPVIGQMIESMKKYKKHVVAVEKVEKSMISSYGIIKPEKIANRIYNITDMAEKPSASKAFSNLGIVGRYILPATIFSYIKKTKPGAKGEIQLTDALKMVMEKEGLIANEFTGDRCDSGDKYGYLMATLKYAKMQGDIAQRLRRDVKKIFKF